MSQSDFVGTSFTSTADFVPDPAVSHKSAYNKSGFHDPNAIGLGTTQTAPGMTHALEFKQAHLIRNISGSMRWGHAGEATKFYIFVKRYYDYTHPQIGNMKTVRFWQGGTAKYFFMGRGSDNGGVIQAVPGGPGDGTNNNADFLGGGIGVHGRELWITDECIYIQNSANNIYDGVFKMYYNNSKVFSSGATGDEFFANLVNGNTNPYDEFWTQQNEANEPDGTWVNERLYWNNWYFDDTLARVMITNNPVYENSTIVEVQPLIAWDDPEITIRFRKGALLSGANSIHVFDQNDNSQYTGEIEVA